MWSKNYGLTSHLTSILLIFVCIITFSYPSEPFHPIAKAIAQYAHRRVLAHTQYKKYNACSNLHEEIQMANQKYVKRLIHSVPEWNRWRLEEPPIEIDLSSADFRERNLCEADLSHANLSYADLSDAELVNADLREADLNHANLSGAFLYLANLRGANLSNTELAGTILDHTDLSYANLSGAILVSAQLRDVNLSDANLDNTNFHWSFLIHTLFARVDLSHVKRLEKAFHIGPSSVDINSVILPHEEQTHLHFLRGVGFTETQIEHLPSLLVPRSLEYESLFISYASQDEAFVQRLYADLRKKDVPCWFAPHDLEPGDYFREEIDKAIDAQEKLLLILSKHSMESRWVKYEVSRALNREIEQDRKILYPIRVDDAVLKSTSGWAADLSAHRHIGDFTDWQDDAAYQEAFTKLLQHLKLRGKDENTGI